MAPKMAPIFDSKIQKITDWAELKLDTYAVSKADTSAHRLLLRASRRALHHCTLMRFGNFHSSIQCCVNFSYFQSYRPAFIKI